MTSNRLCFCVALWVALTANHSFWSLVFSVNGTGLHTWLFAASLLVAVTALHTFVLRVLSPGRAIRIMLSALLLVAATTSWFMDTYGVSVDGDMLRNVVQTNRAEASDFMGWPLLWRLFWQAGLPICLIWRAALPATTWLQSSRDYVVGCVLSIAILLVAAFPMYATYASFFRNHQTAQHLIAPTNVIRAASKLALKNWRAGAPFVVVDARARRLSDPHSRPMLTLVVVGETARAANFSLGGYPRKTNTQLAQRDVLYFSNVKSCGTATAISVPCMFSDLPRGEFDPSMADHRDTVLDLLRRTGLPVTWVDNQDGCKGVCARVTAEQADKYSPVPCNDHKCLDDVLLRVLDKYLPAVATDSVLILHQMGSHGPTYYRRVPPERIAFKPTCATERIETCSAEQIVNAYDNSIAYTDYVLAGLIDRLQKDQDHLDSVLIYLSDHGESLGEHGVYLHGEPYSIAPGFQKQVPMLMWFSTGMVTRLGIDMKCMRSKLTQPFSHDNLSHTLLGLNDIDTTAYRPQLDALRSCRSSAKNK